MLNRSNTVIAIPTYNERENLPDILAEIRQAAPQVDILVVDDNSPDGTGDLADTLARHDPQLHVLHHGEKQGLGPAYLAAFAWAVSHDYLWVGEFDADGSHQPTDLPRLLSLAQGTSQPDLVIGSRWCRGGGVRGWALSRQILSRAGSCYVNLWGNLKVRDTTAGFRVYRTDFLSRLLSQEKITSVGYGFQIEMTWKTQRLGGKIIEVPITFVNRRAGASKMSGSIITEALLQVARWRWRELFSQPRLCP